MAQQQLSDIVKLKEYITFIIEQPELEKENIKHKTAIIESIVNIENKQFNHPEWAATISIFDFNIQNNPSKHKGIYWLNWSIHCEADIMGIEAKQHSIDNDGYSDNEIIFGLYIHLKHETVFDGLYFSGNTNINEFIISAQKFRSNIKGALNNVEIEMEAW